MLLQAGADAFAACYVKGDATSALHLAVKRGYLRCVEVTQGTCSLQQFTVSASCYASTPHPAAE